jgi:hypothetical protein
MLAFFEIRFFPFFSLLFQPPLPAVIRLTVKAFEMRLVGKIPPIFKAPVFLIGFGIVIAGLGMYLFEGQKSNEEKFADAAESVFQEYALEIWSHRPAPRAAEKSEEVKRPETIARRPVEPAKVPPTLPASYSPPLRKVSGDRSADKVKTIPPPVLHSSVPPASTEAISERRDIWREQIVESLGYEEPRALAAEELFEKRWGKLWHGVKESLLDRSKDPDPQRALDLLEQIENSGFQYRAPVAFYRGIALFLDAQRRDLVADRGNQAKVLERAIASLAEANSRKIEIYKQKIRGFEQVAPERLILTISLLQGLAYHELYLDDIREGDYRQYCRFNARDKLTKYLAFARRVSEPPGNIAYISGLLEKSL